MHVTSERFYQIPVGRVGQIGHDLNRPVVGAIELVSTLAEEFSELAA